MPELVRQLDVHRVIVIPGEASGDTLVDAVARAKASGVKVSILPRMFEVVGSSVEFDDIDGVTVLGVRRFGLGRSSERVKRMMDLFSAGVGLLGLSPLLAGVAIAIKLDSRGPVFYRQWRVGRDGRPFRMVKFRSMVQNADELKAGLNRLNVAGGGLFKVIDDPRITPVGRVLRIYRVDEIPQLINVIRGEMNVVGPRPERPSIFSRLCNDIAEYPLRQRAMPGITGLAQVSQSYDTNVDDVRSKVRYDLEYIRRKGVAEDLAIMARTLPVMIFRKGGW